MLSTVPRTTAGLHRQDVVLDVELDVEAELDVEPDVEAEAMTIAAAVDYTRGNLTILYAHPPGQMTRRLNMTRAAF